MHFDHERLDAHQVALDFLVYAEGLIRKLPRGRAHFADQLGRAALSVVLNIAEGAGKVSAGDKRRHHLSARGSATEAAALLDALSRVALLDEPNRAEGKEMLLRIVSMLVKLARNLELGSAGTAISKQPNEGCSEL
jgi:four helix bundle protein